MLETLTAATFEPHVGATFRARLGDAPAVDLTLIEVGALTFDGDPRRQRPPFRLVFRDASSRILRQSIFDIEHEAFEPMGIFLVPVRADASGVYVEAIFA